MKVRGESLANQRQCRTSRVRWKEKESKKEQYEKNMVDFIDRE